MRQATMRVALLALFIAGGPRVAGAAAQCAQNEAWDDAMSMCMPAPAGPQAGWQIAGQLDAYAVYSFVPGPRGANRFAAPGNLMLAVSRSPAAGQLLSAELMTTAELWTYPRTGYPELLQVGEERADGAPYIDAQHPHSSPVMGLTFAWQKDIADGRSLRLSFAPRGQASDGPIAYMHRSSARDNPDAPLGHHVGQDVGHISSTVLAARLALGGTTIEASAFNGTEPAPTRVDLPLGTPDSMALRISRVIAPGHRLMASAARVRQSDAQFPGSSVATRWSASTLDHVELDAGYALDHSLVWGMIGRDGGARDLHSLLDEGILVRGATDAWWRAEAAQRLASELALPGDALQGGGGPGGGGAGGASPGAPRWVGALTLGATHWLAGPRDMQFGIGASLTLDRLPADWATAYGGRMPLTARLLVHLRASVPGASTSANANPAR